MKVRGSSDRPLDQPSLARLSLQKGEATPRGAESLENLLASRARYRNDPPFFHPSENCS